MNDKERDNLASQLTECIRDADEFDYLSGKSLAACGELLATVTEPEEASWVCSVGVWLWQNGLNTHALNAYDHAWDLRQEPPILLNKAVCQDDAGDRDGATETLRAFIRMVTDSDELETVHQMLISNDKEDLWDAAANN